MIIIPDIHGRSFWKDAVAQAHENEQIIFLGDYVDVYPQENIDNLAAIDNFNEIVQYKNEHPNQVTLLLGNHDFMFYISQDMGYCRTDFINAHVISDIFEKNHDSFKVGVFKEIDGINYTFTHGAVLADWASDPIISKNLNCDVTDICEIICRLNAMWYDNDPNLFKVLNKISMLRGGNADYSSPVWGDYREHKCFNAEFNGWFQIFGHTQQISGPVINDNYACLDCRQAFRLENGKFITLTADTMDYKSYM